MSAAESPHVMRMSHGWATAIRSFSSRQSHRHGWRDHCIGGEVNLRHGSTLDVALDGPITLQ